MNVCKLRTSSHRQTRYMYSLKFEDLGMKKSEHILFYNFYFQKKYKRNATKAIRNTQIGCLNVMIVCSLIDR